MKTVSTDPRVSFSWVTTPMYYPWGEMMDPCVDGSNVHQFEPVHIAFELDQPAGSMVVKNPAIPRGYNLYLETAPERRAGIKLDNTRIGPTIELRFACIRCKQELRYSGMRVGLLHLDWTPESMMHLTIPSNEQLDKKLTENDMLVPSGGYSIEGSTSERGSGTPDDTAPTGGAV